MPRLRTKPQAEKSGTADKTTMVLARHAVTGIEIGVILPRGAKFKHVKRALAKVPCKDIMTTGQLMRKVGGTYVAYKDHHPVEGVELVLVARADFGAISESIDRAEVALSDGELSGEETRHCEKESLGDGAEVEIHTIPIAFSPENPASGVSDIGKKSRTEFVERPNSPLIKPILTLKQALALQRELLYGFSTESFLQDLAELRESTQSRIELFQGRQRLLLSVQRQVLPRYGFEGTRTGVLKMMGQMGSFIEDPEFAKFNIQINQLIGIRSRPETWSALARCCEAEAGWADPGTWADEAQHASGILPSPDLAPLCARGVEYVPELDNRWLKSRDDLVEASVHAEVPGEAAPDLAADASASKVASQQLAFLIRNDKREHGAIVQKCESSGRHEDLLCDFPSREFIVDNSELKASTNGLAYRLSPLLDDKDGIESAPWGTIVKGILEGDSWLLVGERYLPMKVKGVSVLILKPTKPAASNTFGGLFRD